jgi:hypothetical protein
MPAAMCLFGAHQVYSTLLQRARCPKVLLRVHDRELFWSLGMFRSKLKLHVTDEIGIMSNKSNIFQSCSLYLIKLPLIDILLGQIKVQPSKCNPRTS